MRCEDRLLQALHQSIMEPVFSTKDLKPCRSSDWVVESIHLINWLEVSPWWVLTPKHIVEQIVRIQDYIVADTGFKNVRTRAYRHLEWLRLDILRVYRQNDLSFLDCIHQAAEKGLPSADSA